MDDKKSKKTRPENKKAATSAATKTAVRATNAPKQKTATETPASQTAAKVWDKSKELASDAKENFAPRVEKAWDKTNDVAAKTWDKTKEVAAEARDKAKDKIDDWRDKK